MRPADRRQYEPYRFTIDLQASWKSYPVRVVAPTLSRCHRKPALLAQATESGLVQGVCTAPGCGKLTTLSQTGFRELRLWVACPKCQQCMLPEMPVSGYGFSCERCHIYVRLADLLPREEEVASLVARDRTGPAGAA
jgi:hypothetical protein